MFDPIAWAKIRFKKFDQPIEEMSNDDKQLYLHKLLINSDTIGLDDKIFQIIDSFEESYKKYLVANLRIYVLYYIKNDKLRDEFYKKFFIKYYTKDEILNMLMVNYIDYRGVYADLFEYIVDQLTDIEIGAILSTCYFLSEEQRIRIKECILLKTDYHINSHNVSTFINYEDNGKNLDLIKRLDKNERVLILENQMKFLLNDEFLRDKVLNLLDRYERLFLMDDNTPYEKFSFEELEKLYFLSEKIGFYKIDDYLKLYSLDELNSFMNNLLSKGYDENVLFNLRNYINNKNRIQEFTEYESLNTQEEKINYIIANDINVFNDYMYLDIIPFMDKQYLQNKAYGMKFYSCEFLFKAGFNVNEICDFIINGTIICNGNFLNDFLEYCSIKQLKLIIDKIDFTGDYLNVVCRKIYESKCSEEKKEIIFDKLNDSFDFCMDCFDFEEVKYYADNYPNIFKNIDFPFGRLGVDELINLSDSYISNLHYAKTVFNIYYDKCNNVEKLDDKKIKILKEYDCNSEFFSNIRSEQLSISLLDKAFDSFNDDIRIYLISNESVVALLDEHNKYSEYVSKLDKGEEILKLYSAINDDNYNKLAIDKKSDVFMAKYYFRSNIPIIYNHLDEIKRLLDINPYVLFTIKYDLLRFFEGKELDYFSRFNIKLNHCKEDKVELIKLALNKLKSKVDFPEKYLIHFIELLSAKDVDLSNIDIEKIIYYLNKKPNIFEAYHNPKYVLENILLYEEKYFEKVFNNENSSIDDLRDIVLRKHFYMDINEAKKLLREYGSSIDDLISKYDINNISEKTREEVLILNTLKIIDSLLHLEDVELLRKCFVDLNIDDLKFYYLDNLVFEDVIRNIYNRELISNLSKLNDSENTSVVKYHNSSIPVYEYKDDFCMLVSVIGAYVKNKDALKNPYADWCGDTKTANHGICTSLIANDNLSLAKMNTNKVLVYGFYNIEESAIEKAANYDLGSNSNNIEIVSTFESCFRTTRDMINNTRHGHSELVLERRTISSDNKVVRRNPDYVIAINNITDLHKKAASQFGVPIVVLNIEEIAFSENNKLENIMVQMRRNINSSLLSEFVIKYHNNYAGLISNFPKYCKKYFNPSKYKKYFEEIVSIINRVYDPVKKYEIANNYLTLLKEENSRRISVYYKYRPFEFTSIISGLEKIIESIKLPEVSVDNKVKDNENIEGDVFINTEELEEKNIVGMKR